MQRGDNIYIGGYRIIQLMNREMNGMNRLMNREVNRGRERIQLAGAGAAAAGTGATANSLILITYSNGEYKVFNTFEECIEYNVDDTNYDNIKILNY